MSDNKPKKVVTPYYQRPSDEQLKKVEDTNNWIWGVIFVVGVLLICMRGCAATSETHNTETQERYSASDY